MEFSNETPLRRCDGRETDAVVRRKHGLPRFLRTQTADKPRLWRRVFVFVEVRSSREGFGPHREEKQA